MQHPSPPQPPRADLSIGSRTVPAAPVHLDGHAASIVVQPGPETDARGWLRLAWEDGQETALEVVVRGFAGAVAQMEICGVQGDWRPFLAYVGGGRR